jgi:hypothetical protein
MTLSRKIIVFKPTLQTTNKMFCIELETLHIRYLATEWLHDFTITLDEITGERIY